MCQLRAWQIEITSFTVNGLIIATSAVSRPWQIGAMAVWFLDDLSPQESTKYEAGCERTSYIESFIDSDQKEALENCLQASL